MYLFVLEESNKGNDRLEKSYKTGQEEKITTKSCVRTWAVQVLIFRGLSTENYLTKIILIFDTVKE